MRYRNTSIHTETQQQWLHALWEAAATAEKNKKSVSFLKGVLTDSEQLSIARRLLIARMLLAGEPHSEIRLRAQVSPNTVCTVSAWLSAQMPEYGHALKKVAAKADERKQKRAKQTSWYHSESVLPLPELRRKYPLHFLLFNIADEILVRRKRKQKKK